MKKNKKLKMTPRSKQTINWIKSTRSALDAGLTKDDLTMMLEELFGDEK